MSYVGEKIETILERCWGSSFTPPLPLYMRDSPLYLCFSLPSHKLVRLCASIGENYNTHCEAKKFLDKRGGILML